MYTVLFTVLYTVLYTVLCALYFTLLYTVHYNRDGNFHKIKNIFNFYYYCFTIGEMGGVLRVASTRISLFGIMLMPCIEALYTNTM